ncbi:MAG: hypothetical protein IJB01_07420 [Bacteroidaceae bacterium]|nr:hypothetical protein [Bacteroidaceae bacterium]
MPSFFCFDKVNSIQSREAQTKFVPRGVRKVDFVKAQFGIEEMCRDSWNWQKNNPNGFEE